MEDIILNTKKEDKYLIVYPKGRLDLAISSQVEDELNNLVSSGHSHIILNMKDVEYMSSSGFRACISVLRKLKVVNGSLKICNVQPDVNRIFEVIELDSLFDVYKTEEEALKS